jgi:hypothetical protein
MAFARSQDRAPGTPPWRAGTGRGEPRVAHGIDGLAGRIQGPQQPYERLKDEFVLAERGPVEGKTGASPLMLLPPPEGERWGEGANLPHVPLQPLS